MNINDYLVWRGDIPLSSDFPFNDVDALILARFSYLPFDKIKLSDETISSISSKMEKLDVSFFKIDDDKLLIHNLGKSVRFKDLKVTDFVFNRVKSLEKQFSTGAKPYLISFSVSSVLFLKMDCISITTTASSHLYSQYSQ